MIKGDYLTILLKSPQTVFSFNEIMMIWQESAVPTALVRVNYYVKKGTLIKLRKGLYAKTKDFNVKEAATKIYTPAYISFETALKEAGITFQWYDSIFVASYVTREIHCANNTFRFQRIPPDILSNPAGIINKGAYAIATPERAFLDAVYHYKEYHFDNLSPLDWKLVHELLPIYHNKTLAKLVERYYHAAQRE